MSSGCDSTALGSKPEVLLSGGAIGEVWLCGGQSNMAMPVCYVSDAGEDLFPMSSDVSFFANGHGRKKDPSNVQDLPGVPF